MRRRKFVKLSIAAMAAWPIPLRAQQVGKLTRIGFLRYASPHEKQFNAFRTACVPWVTSKGRTSSSSNATRLECCNV